MDFSKLVCKRYSTRNFLAQPVQEKDLLKILEAGRVAPTATNRQPLKLLVLRGETALAALAQAANVYGAPLVIVVCADHKATWKRSYDGKDIGDVDASIVTTHMMLQATDLGLASLWVCHFDPAILRANFRIPDTIEPVNILAIGHEGGQAKAADRHASQRKALEELVVWDSFPAVEESPHG